MIRYSALLVFAASVLVISGIPASAQSVFIDRSNDLMLATDLTDPAGGALGSPFPNQSVHPLFDPLIEPAGSADDGHSITVDVPDMDPTPPASGRVFWKV